MRKHYKEIINWEMTMNTINNKLDKNYNIGYIQNIYHNRQGNIGITKLLKKILK